MKSSKSNIGYNFIDKSENVFKAYSYECGLPNKVLELLKFGKADLSVRFCDERIICVNQGSMLIWKYANKKAVVSSYSEYQLPHCGSGNHSANQVIVIGTECVTVTNDGNVRYWPQLNMPLQYLDSHIGAVSYGDKCCLVEKIDSGDRVLVALFRSRKVILLDLRDCGDCGITFKSYSQPQASLFGSVGRYLSSFIVSSDNNKSEWNCQSRRLSFSNVKINNLLQEETELLIMADNNIDSLTLDVLLNGQYKREILQLDFIKKSIFDRLLTDPSRPTQLSELNIILEGFDLCRNIIYILVQIQSKESSNHVLLTYNRLIADIDSVVFVNIDIIGDLELSVIVDESTVEPCLSVAIKDNRSIYIVEVLTGTVKCELNTEASIKPYINNNNNSITSSIMGWDCPLLADNPNIKIVTLTVDKQLIIIKQNITLRADLEFKSFRNSELDFNISNASFSDCNVSKKKLTSFRADVSIANISQFPFTRPSALSTPNSRYDPKGDKFVDNKNEVDLNMSMSTLGVLDNMVPETSEFGIFKKSVMLFWHGYESQAKRILNPLIERASNNNDISLAMFVLHITREIVDEYPSKDPRWSKIDNVHQSNGFFYSNKSLLLPQQLNSKKDALRKLILMLKENDVDIFGTLGCIAPMSVCQSLYMQRGVSEFQLFGSSQVTWSVVHCVWFGVELMEFTLILNEIMSSEDNDEINQILAKCCQHLLAMQRKLTPLEIISQEISLIPRFIRDCADYLKERYSLTNVPEKASDTKNICILIGKILSSCLKSSLKCRQYFEESFLSVYFNAKSFPISIASCCWITENQPIGVLDSILDIIHSLLHFSKSVDYRIFESTIDVVNVLLDCFKYRLEWMKQFSSNDIEYQRLDGTFGDIRSKLIEKIVEEDRAIDTALSLADKFADFYWLTKICEILDNQSKSKSNCHIETFLRKYSTDGLSEYVLDWYQDRLKGADAKNQGKYLAKVQIILEKIQKIDVSTNVSNTKMETSSSSHVIGKFLEKAEVQTTRWLHEIEIGDFSQAATTLGRLGEMEETSLYRRKTLLGLAKLSCLATNDFDIEETEEAINVIDKHLKLIGFQENIPAEVLELHLAIKGDLEKQPVLNVSKMVKLLLAAASSGKTREGTRYFVTALELMDLCWFNNRLANVSKEALEQLLMMIWSDIIGQDDWSQMSTEQGYTTSTVYKVITAGLDKGLSNDVLLPDLDKLFDSNRSNIPSSSNVEFLVRITFESILSDINTNDNGDSDNGVMYCN